MLPRVIGVSGGFGAGKDEIAKVLVSLGYVRMAFGDFLKYEVKAMLESDAVRYDIWDEMPAGCRDAALTCLALGQFDPFVKPTTPEIRLLLQQYGTEYRREQSIWHWTDLLGNEWLAQGYERIVIPDVRFGNERQWIKKQGGECWKVVRATEFYNYDSLKNHKSERDLDTAQFDLTLLNSGTLEDLHRRVRFLIDQPRPFETPLTATDVQAA